MPNIDSHLDGFFQSSKFIIDFIQFILLNRCGDNPCPCLVKQGIVPAHERTDHDGMIYVPVKTEISDGPSIETPARGLVVVDEFHCPEFGRSGKGSCRKGIGKHLTGLYPSSENPGHLGNQVNDM